MWWALDDVVLLVWTRFVAVVRGNRRRCRSLHSCIHHSHAICFGDVVVVAVGWIFLLSWTWIYDFW